MNVLKRMSPRRNQMMNQRNESVTVDQFLEPLEGRSSVNAPYAIEDDLLDGLEPMDKSTDIIKEEMKEVSNLPEIQRRKSRPGKRKPF